MRLSSMDNMFIFIFYGAVMTVVGIGMGIRYQDAYYVTTYSNVMCPLKEFKNNPTCDGFYVYKEVK